MSTECTCRIAPPCAFCTSLTEEEANVYANGGLAALNRYRSQREIGTSCDKCGHFHCICPVRERHKEDCRFRRAVELSVELACDHGFQVCPVCDPCDCGAGEDRGVR